MTNSKNGNRRNNYEPLPQHATECESMTRLAQHLLNGVTGRLHGLLREAAKKGDLGQTMGEHMFEVFTQMMYGYGRVSSRDTKNMNHRLEAFAALKAAGGDKQYAALMEVTSPLVGIWPLQFNQKMKRMETPEEAAWRLRTQVIKALGIKAAIEHMKKLVRAKLLGIEDGKLVQVTAPKTKKRATPKKTAPAKKTAAPAAAPPSA